MLIKSSRYAWQISPMSVWSLLNYFPWGLGFAKNGQNNLVCLNSPTFSTWFTWHLPQMLISWSRCAWRNFYNFCPIHFGQLLSFCTLTLQKWPFFYFVEPFDVVTMTGCFAWEQGLGFVLRFLLELFLTYVGTSVTFSAIAIWLK